MKAASQVLLEMVLLAAIAAAVSLSANALRADGLELSRNYFAIRKPTAAPERAAAILADPQTTVEGQAVESAGLDAVNTEPDAPDHGLQIIGVDEVAALADDPGATIGTYLFIDARDEDHYSEGHIPNAFLVNHYHLERYLPEVLPLTDDAEKIIVYCTGGTCEDSILVCYDLLETGVPYEKVFLFHDGWKAWTAEGLAVEKGTP